MLSLPTTAILGVALGGLALILLRAWNARHPDRLDRSAHDRIAERLQEIVNSDGAAAPVDSPTAGPRLRLWLDASVVLVGIGAVMLVVLAITGDNQPSGSVLGIVATPEPTVAERPTALRAEATDVVDQPGGAVAASQPPSPRPSARAGSGVASPALAPSPTPAINAGSRAPSADRMAVLRPCQGRADCYVYVVRRGDNLVSIAHWFGIPFDTMVAMNPGIDEHGLRPGDRIVLPTPRR